LALGGADMVTRMDLRRVKLIQAAFADRDYSHVGSAAGTAFLFEDGGIADDRVPEFLQCFDEALLPEASLDEHNLSFTVVRGRVLGDFRPERDASPPRAA
jgi:hypothetical protein